MLTPHSRVWLSIDKRPDKRRLQCEFTCVMQLLFTLLTYWIHPHYREPIPLIYGLGVI